jgi:hypothetical protein
MFAQAVKSYGASVSLCQLKCSSGHRRSHVTEQSEEAKSYVLTGRHYAQGWKSEAIMGNTSSSDGKRPWLARQD